MKRDLPSSSKDSYQPPNSTKKIPTLHFFLKIEKTTNEETFIEKIQTVKEQVKQNEVTNQVKEEMSIESNNSNNSGKRNNQNFKASNEHHKTFEEVDNQKFENEGSIPYTEVEMSSQEKDQLVQKYLRINFRYACEECFRDITNHTKLKVEDKIYCVGCAAEIVKTEYTIIRPLEGESLINFGHQKEEGIQSELVWSLKDELLLIEASELYGLESYELIKNHMKTDHSIEQIKYRQEYFIQKFTSETSAEKKEIDINYKPHSINIQIQIDYSDKKSIDEEFVTVKDVDERTQKLLKIFRFNEKRDEFDYERHSGFYELMASQITKEDLKNHHEDVKLIMKGRQNEIIQKQILDKVLKKQLLSKSVHSKSEEEMEEKEKVRKKEKEQEIQQMMLDIRYKEQEALEKEQESNSDSWKDIEDDKSEHELYYEDDCDESNEDEDDDEDLDINLSENLQENQKWKLFEAQLITKYNILDHKTNPISQRVFKTIKLLDQMNTIKIEAQQNLEVMKKKYCQQRKIQNITMEEFGHILSESLVKKIYKHDQLEKIWKELAELRKERDKKKSIH